MQDYQRLLALSILAYAVQKNLSAERLCHLAGVDFDGLRDGTQPVTAKQAADLWLNATHLSRDAQFGLHFGESLQLTALGVVGGLIQNSRTIGEALTQAAAFTHLITDIIAVKVERTDLTFTIQFMPNRSRQRESPLVFRQVMDFFMAFMIHEVDGLVLAKIQPSAVKMPHLDSERPEYERVLRCRSIQQSDNYALTFDGRYWNEPILTANYELQSLLLQKVTAMDRAFGTTRKVSDRIGSYLLANANLGIPSLETIAANFNTSPRSLQRKLQEEGLTYQQVADSIRKSLAIHFLESGQHPLKEVSYILGYNELSAFSRAFKRWTGTTPGSYQINKQVVYPKKPDGTSR